MFTPSRAKSRFGPRQESKIGEKGLAKVGGGRGYRGEWCSLAQVAGSVVAGSTSWNHFLCWLSSSSIYNLPPPPFPAHLPKLNF